MATLKLFNPHRRTEVHFIHKANRKRFSQNRIYIFIWFSQRISEWQMRSFFSLCLSAVLVELNVMAVFATAIVSSIKPEYKLRFIYLSANVERKTTSLTEICTLNNSIKALAPVVCTVQYSKQLLQCFECKIAEWAIFNRSKAPTKSQHEHTVKYFFDWANIHNNNR